MQIEPPSEFSRQRAGWCLMLARTATCIAAGIVGASIFATASSTAQVDFTPMVIQSLSIVLLFIASVWLAHREGEQNSERALRILEFIRLDPLTGILNRSFFIDGMRSHGGDGALLIIDADHFKAINDRFGHHSGDIALVQMTNAVSSATPHPGLVGRLGGEEFGVFIPGVNLSRASEIAELVRKEVEALDFCIDDVSVPLSVSIGVSLHKAVDPVRQAFKSADENLYSAKRSGRNRIAIASNPVHELQTRISSA